MDPHSLEVLEFPKIRGIVGEYALTEMGSRLVGELSPIQDPDRLRRALKEVTSMRMALDSGGGFPLARLSDPSRWLKIADVEGSRLDPKAIVEIHNLAKISRQVTEFLSARKKECPLLWEITSEIRPFTEIEEAVRRCLDLDTCEVLDTASTALKKIRRERERLSGDIREKLNSILGSARMKDVFQDNLVSIRNQRLVLPVKAGEKAKVKGIVHDRSSSGQTLFVEPLATVEMNNRLTQLTLEEAKEIERILIELTSQIGERSRELDYAAKATGEIDLIYAKAKTAIQLECNEPNIEDSGLLELLNARHPVLMIALEKPQDVVPINIEVGGSFKTLVISGPNTGGKTVALKTAGLLSIMALSGLHIPASADSTVGFFSQVFADIGDEQSIEQNLSTFSSHMKQIVNVMDKADGKSLVLLDEIGAGTDPQEGSALAMSILKDLTERGTKTIASTHHSALKLFASSEEGMENGSMQFDPDTLMPTFHFTMGIPGRSNAFEIASRLGLKGEIIEGARGFSSKEQEDLNSLVGEMSARHKQLMDELKDARSFREDVQRLAEEYESKIDEVEREKRRIKKGAAREQRRIVKEARELVEKVVEEIRTEKASRDSIVRAREKLVGEALRAEEGLSEEESGGTKPSRITPGMKVRVSGLDNDAIVLSEPDNQGRVRLQTKVGTIQVPSSRVYECEDTQTKAEQVSASGSYELSDSSGTPLELDLRGMRADEIQEILEKRLDRVVLDGLGSVCIIHGKGTGALRRRVHQILSASPHVKAFRLGGWNEGGSGVTVVELS